MQARQSCSKHQRAHEQQRVLNNEGDRFFLGALLLDSGVPQHPGGQQLMAPPSPLAQQQEQGNQNEDVENGVKTAARQGQGRVEAGCSASASRSFRGQVWGRLTGNELMQRADHAIADPPALQGSPAGSAEQALEPCRVPGLPTSASNDPAEPWPVLETAAERPDPADAGRSGTRKQSRADQHQSAARLAGWRSCRPRSIARPQLPLPHSARASGLTAFRSIAPCHCQQWLVIEWR